LPDRHGSVRRSASLLALLAVAAGCGTPEELSKQAEEVQSVAAEGSLLAHAASEGSTTGVFTREHAKALRKLLRKLRPAIEDRQLAGLADRTDAALERLEVGDERGPGRLEEELSSLAEAVGQLAP